MDAIYRMLCGVDYPELSVSAAVMSWGPAAVALFGV
jgi:hypothetical protein